MRYTDLVGTPVYTSDAERLGTVRDIGFEQSRLADGRIEFRVCSLECRDSPAIGHRFGWGKGDMGGPWPLSRIFTRLQEKDSVVVAWRDLARITPARIDVRRTAREMRSS
jgi:hypothetical protein